MRHNKKRNTALIYEFLVRHVSDCVLTNKKSEAKKSLDLIKKYYSKESPLSEELKYMKVLVNTNSVKSRDSAEKIIDEVYRHAKGMNVRRLDESKSKLISEINKGFDESLYSYKVPNYRFYATAQILLNNLRNKKTLLESVEKIKLQDVIVDHLMENSIVPFNALKINPTYNKTVCNLIVKKFNEKYSKSLNENQMKLLSQYVVYLVSGKTTDLTESINENLKTFKSRLRNVKDEQINKDSDLTKKLNECYEKLVTTDFSNINEENIMKLMQYMKLVEEVETT